MRPPSSQYEITPSIWTTQDMGGSLTAPGEQAEQTALHTCGWRAAERLNRVSQKSGQGSECGLKCWVPISVSLCHLVATEI